MTAFKEGQPQLTTPEEKNIAMKINLQIYPDNRYKKNSMKLYAYASFTYLNKSNYHKFATGLEIGRHEWDFKKKIVKGNSLEATTIRDRMFRIKDFAKSLNLPTGEEIIAAVKNFIGLTNEELNEKLKIVRLSDYVGEFIKLNAKKYSYHTLGKYRRLQRNIQMYCDLNKLTDCLETMTSDQQTIFFSGYLDFLISHEVKSEKKLYENGSVKQEFQSLGKVCHTFTTGLKIPLEFAADLGEGNTQMTFCPPEEVMAIYHASKSENMNLTEEKAVDCFLFQAFTGPRHQDLYQVEDARITMRMAPDGSAYKVWTFVQDKKKKENSVPLNAICLEIIDKWRKRDFKSPEKRNLKSKEVSNFNNCLLPVLPSSKTNKALHEFLKRVEGFDRIEKIVRYSGEKRVERDVPRYDLITTHVARHSYVHLLMHKGLTMDESGQLVNHGSVETTSKHYKHFKDDELMYKAYKVLNG